MRDTEVAYKNVVLIPLAAYDEGLYAAMLIVREVNGLQRASGVLGHFSGPVEARQFALSYGMAEIDDRPPGAHAALRQPSGTEASMLRCAA